MSKLEHKHIEMHEEYFRLSLKAIDLFIIAVIEEYDEQNKPCYLTDEQLTKITSCSLETISRSIRKLENLNIISRETMSSNQRLLSLNKRENWMGRPVNTVTNQKVVCIRKSYSEDSILDIHSYRDAQADLSIEAWSLYSHLIVNVSGYRIALSAADITQKTTLKERGYYKAVNELIEKKYLCKEDNPEYKNYYVLYERPNI